MMTRSEYMEASSGDNWRETQPSAHRQYYAQFVTPAVKEIVLQHVTLARLLKSTHRSFNDIPLKWWDALPSLMSMAAAMKMAEDYLTLAGKVCIYKEAARQIVEEQTEVQS